MIIPDSATQDPDKLGNYIPVYTYNPYIGMEARLLIEHLVLNHYITLNLVFRISGEDQKSTKWPQETRLMRYEKVYESGTKKCLTQEEAAELLGVCARTFRRQINRYEDD